MFILNRLRFIVLCWPFRWALLLGALLVMWVLGTDNPLKEEGAIPVELDLIIWMILMSSFSIVLIAFLILCLYWCLLFFQRKKIQLQYDGTYFILQNVFQPFLGALRLRLKRNQHWDYDAITMTPLPLHRFHLGRITMQGQLKHAVPAIRVEQVDGMLIHLVDTFHFFSFSMYVPMQLHYEQNPIEGASYPELKLQGNVDTDDVNRLMSIKKQSGDLFQLKSFEPGDDIRRIVWKLFARHQTLMVRKPDIEIVYAKHISVLVIFDFTSIPHAHGDLLTYFEAIYKQHVYDVLCGLLAKGSPTDLSFNGTSWYTSVTASELKQIITGVNCYEPMTLYEMNSNSMPDLVFISSLAHEKNVSSIQAMRLPCILVDLFQSLQQAKGSFWVTRLMIRPKNEVQYQLHRAWLRCSKRKQLLQDWNGVQEKLAHLTILYVA
ncbi:MAG: DUF58 domain-containing protein [Chitinophagaceae bacterium]|nr:DUF58 domain-containing protein [Chitinophagaceae bacterium]